MKKLTTVFLISFFFFSACVEKIKLDLRSGTQRLVVEGIFTNEAKPCTVKLSYSQAIDVLKNITFISGARVQLSDDSGNFTEFVEIPTITGNYQPKNQQFGGVVGRTYVLTIELPDGKKFVSKPETMQTAPPIENIYVEYDGTTKSFNGSKLFGYKVYIDAKDPAERTNYYRWTSLTYAFKQTKLFPCSAFQFPPTCRNVYWCLEAEKDILIGSDAGINGNTIRKQYVHFSPVYLLGTNYIEIQQQAISAEIYRYWKNYTDQTLRTGSIFDPIPSTIVGNVYNVNNPTELALGYFSVGAVSIKRMSINTINIPNGRNLMTGYGEKFDSDPCQANTVVYVNRFPVESWK
jgi:hypothetical protein